MKRTLCLIFLAVVCQRDAQCLGFGENKGQHLQLSFVDDQQEPIRQVLEVCVFLGVDRECEEVDSEDLFDLFGAFDLVRIEGPRHGPVSSEPSDLALDSSGVARLVVPRKAALIVGDLPSAPPAVTLSLYRMDDPLFRTPIFREILQEGPLFVPAGRFVASFSSPGTAPDLQALVAKPGGTHHMTYRQRPGWSAVIRLLHPQDRAPAEGAKVALTSLTEYSETAASNNGRFGSPKHRTTNSSGLALFSGIGVPLARASVTHESYLDTHIPALTSTPGTFAFQETILERGGSLRAMITLDDVPAVDAECKVLQYERSAPGSLDPPRIVAEVQPDPEGLCRVGRLRRGHYSLRVIPPAEKEKSDRAVVDQSVQVEEGVPTELNVSLHRFVLEGTVYRGDAPAEGYSITVHSAEDPKQNATARDAVARSRSDEEGAYSLVLWKSGDYNVILENDQGTPGPVRKVSISSTPRVLDFHLASDELTGLVTDTEGAPLSDALVQLKWNVFSFRGSITGKNGVFSFPLDGVSGSATITARKDGYRPSAPVDLEVSPGVDLGSISIVLEEAAGIQGALMSGDGSPVAGGLVIGYQSQSNAGPVIAGYATTERSGQFSIALSSLSAVRLFHTGPNCPLGATDLTPAVLAQESELVVQCASLPASLEIVLKDAEGRGRAGSGVILRRGEVIFPREILAMHLARLGIPGAADGSGRVFLVAIEPGQYDLFLSDVTSARNIEAGFLNGYLAKAFLAPGESRSLELTLEEASK